MQSRVVRALMRMIASATGAAMLLGASLGKPAYALELTQMRLDGRCVGVELNGEIRRDEAAKVIGSLHAAADRCGTRNILIGRMPGGSVRDALAIGEAIREREYVTAMLPKSQCYSACGLVYLGGVQRYWREGARFIIHRPEIHETFKTPAAESAAYEDLRSHLIRYVSNMGASPDYVDAMYSVRPRNYETVNRQDMNAWALFMTVGAPF